MHEKNPSFLILTAIIAAAGCSVGTTGNETAQKKGTAVEIAPVTIRKTGTGSDITSFQTDVKVYESNNRSPAGSVLKEQYRLSYKLIEGNLFTRIDYPVDANGLARTVLNNPDEIIIFNRNNNIVEYRATMTQEAENSEGEQKTLFSRVVLDDVTKYYSKLAYRITENKTSNIIAVEIPSAQLSDMLIGGDPLKGESIYFDTILEVACGFEYTVVDENNTTINKVATDLFQDVDGIPIKTGTITVASYSYPAKIDTSDRTLPVLTSLDTIPPITNEKLAALKENGAEIFVMDPILGDPGDRDHTITTVESYEAIELNSLADSYFRLSL